MPRSQWDSQIDELRHNNRSGAAEIASRALDLLIDAVGDSFPSGAISYQRWLLQISRQIMGAQPSMGILFRLVNDMLWACDGAIGSTAMRQDALDFLQDYRMRAGAAQLELSDHAVAYLGRYQRLMTYSRSATVVQTLSALADRKRHLQVRCGEGRPMLEGQTLASELGWAGVSVTIGIDMALFGWLHDVDALVIGADSVSQAGIINKLGTAPLAKAAFEATVPCVVVCAADKLLPNDYLVAQNLYSGHPDEIMPAGNDNVTIRNAYYDITPLELITTVITAQGPITISELTDQLAALRTYPGLLGKQ